MNIQEAIKKGQITLKSKKIKTPELDSQILMSKTFNEDIKFVILNSQDKISKKNLDFFNILINQRAKGKPIAYLLKKKEFWKHEFFVNKNVLIPRPDTEILIEQCLQITKNKNKLNILDIGVGSGCILLSILKEKKNFYGSGVDISNKSLDICKVNTHKLGLINRVKLFKSDIDNFNYGKYDLIISNPPYIKKNDLKCLEKDIIDFEPKKALDGGISGLSEIKKVINKSSYLIKKNGFLVLEIGFNQKNDVKKILNNKGFYIKKVVRDFAKNDRCIISIKI